MRETWLWLSKLSKLSHCQPAGQLNQASSMVSLSRWLTPSVQHRC